MFPCNNPRTKFFQQYSIGLNNVQLLTDVARQGIELMRKNIDYPLFLSFQKYVIATLDIVSRSTGQNLLSSYNLLNSTIASLSLYEQLKRTIEYLLDTANRL